MPSRITLAIACSALNGARPTTKMGDTDLAGVIGRKGCKGKVEGACKPRGSKNSPEFL